MAKFRSKGSWFQVGLLAVGLATGLTAGAESRAEEADLTSAVLLLSDAPRMLQEACPKIGGAGADCRIEKVTVTQQGADWQGRAETRIFHADGRETPLVMTARLDPVNCRLVDRTVVPEAAVARRLLTVTERQLRLAMNDPQGMKTFCGLSSSLLDGLKPPSCLCP